MRHATSRPPRSPHAHPRAPACASISRQAARMQYTARPRWHVGHARPRRPAAEREHPTSPTDNWRPPRRNPRTGTARHQPGRPPRARRAPTAPKDTAVRPPTNRKEMKAPPPPQAGKAHQPLRHHRAPTLFPPPRLTSTAPVPETQRRPGNRDPARPTHSTYAHPRLHLPHPWHARRAAQTLCRL